LINQNPDYFEAMETQYLVQNEIEQDDKYYIHYGLCPQCKGLGEVIDTRGFGMEPCFNPDCLNGELIAK
jgi:uncharacterized protein YlaN (UPF0358 family)